MGDPTTHGASTTRAYQSWLAMKQRCLNKKYPAYRNYGERGIRICDRWMDFANFLADMGQPRPDRRLDRIDNMAEATVPTTADGRHATEQQNNRRVNRRVTINGVTHTVAEWSRLSGIHPNTLTLRIDTVCRTTSCCRASGIVNHPTVLTQPTSVPSARLPTSWNRISPAATDSAIQHHRIRQRRTWKNVPD